MKYFLSSIAMLALLLAGCKQSEKKEEDIKPVKYAQLIYSSGSKTQTFSGVVKAKYETNLSFRVGGSISQVNVNLGDRVRKGQLIASIDPVDYNIQREQAMAQKNSAESQLTSARSTFERIEKLYEKNSVSLSEYEKAKTSLASAKSQMEAAKKQLEAANNQVNYTKLYAPTDGIISQLDIEPNETVGSGRVIAKLSSEGNPGVEVGVPESVINKLQNGQQVTIVFNSLNGKKFNGEIAEVAFASGTSSTYSVIVTITNPDENIRPGMAADVSFNIRNENSGVENRIIAPVEAVGKDSNGNFVFVLHPDTASIYQVEKRNIVIGNLLQEGFEIERGLDGNELVATAGLSFIRDSMKVKLLDK